MKIEYGNWTVQLEYTLLMPVELFASTRCSECLLMFMRAFIFHLVSSSDAFCARMSVISINRITYSVGR